MGLAGGLATNGILSGGVSGSVANDSPGLHIPGGWGANWKAARATAKAGSGLARVAFAGDSLFAGLLSSNLDTKGYVGLIKTALQAAYGNGGSGFKGVADTAQVLDISLAAYGNAVAGLIATTGTWTVSTTPDGPGMQCLESVVSGSTATYAVNGTSASIVYYTDGSASFGSFAVTIDGVSQGTINSDTGGSSGPTAIAEIVYSGLSAGNHTIVITTSGTLAVFICGVSGRNATGVVVDKYARGSFPSTALSNTAAASWKASGTVYTVSTFGNAGQWSGGSLRPCDLCIYGMGLNDAIGGANYSLTTPDTYIANVRRYLDDVKDGSGQTGATDIVLLANHRGKVNPYQEDATTTYYANYIARLRGLADYYGAAFINLGELGHNSWNWMVAQGYMGLAAGTTPGASGTSGTADVVHLSDTGHQWAANQILPILTA